VLLIQVSDSYLLIKDLESVINIQILNGLINDELKNRNDIYDLDEVKRAITRKPYVIICGHASLKGNELLHFIKSYLVNIDAVWKYDKFSPEEILKVKDLLPIFHVIGGNSHGGTYKDTQTIDKEVIPLCNVINKIPGIETFASCSGHGGCRHLYVTFISKDLESLNNFTKLMTDAIDEVYPKYNFASQVNPTMQFNWGNWEHRVGTYFDFRIQYSVEDEHSVYSFVKDISENILKQL